MDAPFHISANQYSDLGMLVINGQNRIKLCMDFHTHTHMHVFMIPKTVECNTWIRAYYSNVSKTWFKVLTFWKILMTIFIASIHRIKNTFIKLPYNRSLVCLSMQLISDWIAVYFIFLPHFKYWKIT